MSEEEKTGVIEQQDVVQEAVAQPTESEQVHDERQDEVQSQQSKRNDAEYNWKETRRQIQERDREIEQLYKELENLKKGLTPSVDDEISKLSEDDIITVGQHRKSVEKISAKIAKQVAEEVIREREALTLEDRLTNKFSDFKTVVTAENIDYLKQTEPELAQSLSAMSQDPYAQGIALYKLLKKVGKVETNSNAYEKKKASENSQKPLSVQAATKQSAIGNAHVFENGLTPDLKKKLYQEMQDAIRSG